MIGMAAGSGVFSESVVACAGHFYFMSWRGELINGKLDRFSPKIESLRLENFQSLRDLADIKISPITFLYGPNSAGKSAIYDSIVFVDAVLKKDQVHIEGYLDRWQHVDGGGGSEGMLGVEMNLVRDNIFGSISETYEAMPRALLEDDGAPIFIRGRSRIGIHIRASRDYEKFFIRIILDGFPIVEVASESQGFYSTLRLYPEVFGGRLEELAEGHGFDPGDPRIFVANCNILFGPLLLEPSVSVGKNHNLDRDFISIANYFIRFISELNFVPTLVSAERGSIPDRALSAVCSIFGRAVDIIPDGTPDFFGKLGIDHLGINIPAGATEDLSKISSLTIKELILSRLREVFEVRVRNFYSKSGALNFVQDVDGQGGLSCEGERLHSFVNRCLSDHLFIDQGYQVRFEVLELLSDQAAAESSQAVPAPSESVEDQFFRFAALIICYLTDTSGRRVTFQDVGTGISCALPVLVALNSLGSFIQQPELHLHPALQSALGDICIEASKRNGGTVHFLETHSEYLLLRCLRRIRETTNGKRRPDDSLAISRDDVSVIYFEPQNDGSTRIKNIRVSSLGDFIDRWPRGFFEERGRDIFDE